MSRRSYLKNATAPPSTELRTSFDELRASGRPNPFVRGRQPATSVGPGEQMNRPSRAAAVPGASPLARECRPCGAEGLQPWKGGTQKPGVKPLALGIRGGNSCVYPDQRFVGSSSKPVLNYYVGKSARGAKISEQQNRFVSLSALRPVLDAG